MQAIVITHRPKKGAFPNDLRLTTVVKPEPRKNEVLIKVVSATITIDDINFGYSQIIVGGNCLIMGGECGFGKGRGQGEGFSLAPLQPEGLVGSVLFLHIVLYINQL